MKKDTTRIPRAIVDRQGDKQGYMPGTNKESCRGGGTPRNKSPKLISNVPVVGQGAVFREKIARLSGRAKED